MTTPFEVNKIEVVARLAEDFFPLACEVSSAAEALIQDFELALFGGLLAVGRKVMRKTHCVHSFCYISDHLFSCSGRRSGAIPPGHADEEFDRALRISPNSSRASK